MSLAKTVARTRTRSKSRPQAVVTLTMADVDALLGVGLELEAVDLFLGLRGYIESGPEHRHHVDILLSAGVEARTRFKVTRDLIQHQLRSARRSRR